MNFCLSNQHFTYKSSRIAIFATQISPINSSKLQPSSPSKSHKSPLSSKGHGTTSITDCNHGEKSSLNITKQQFLKNLRQPSRGDAKETTTMDIHLCGNQLSTYTSRSNFLTPKSWRLFQYDLDFLTLKMTSWRQLGAQLDVPEKHSPWTRKFTGFRWRRSGVIHCGWWLWLSSAIVDGL